MHTEVSATEYLAALTNVTTKFRDAVRHRAGNYAVGDTRYGRKRLCEDINILRFLESEVSRLGEVR